MQNFDFYSGKTVRDVPPQFSREDPEYFARLANVHPKEEHRVIKKASSMLSLIISLCIISFTAGIVIGIKFAAGPDKQLIDTQTREAVAGIGSKVSNLARESSDPAIKAVDPDKKLFSKEDFPYLIKIGKEFNKPASQEIAGIISSRGQTVILSKSNGNYKIYVGPYRTQESATDSLKDIKSFLLNDAVIIKR